MFPCVLGRIFTFSFLVSISGLQFRYYLACSVGSWVDFPAGFPLVLVNTGCGSWGLLMREICSNGSNPINSH